MTSMPMETRASANAALSEPTMRYLANQFLEGISQPDPAALRKEFRRGTLMTERCARLIESRCNACGKDTCILCEAAKEIRSRSDDLYADREREMASESRSQMIDSVIDSVCNDHRTFAEILRDEHAKKEAWAFALTIERGT